MSSDSPSGTERESRSSGNHGYRTSGINVRYGRTTNVRVRPGFSAKNPCSQRSDSNKAKKARPGHVTTKSPGLTRPNHQNKTFGADCKNEYSLLPPHR